MSTDVRFRDRMRAALEDRLFPAWTRDAACRGQELPGRLYRDAFTDEVGQQQDIETYAWPERTVNALRTCAGCPVKRECLEYAFELNPKPRQFGVFSGTPGRIREALGFRDCRTCQGKGYLKRVTIGDTTLRWSDYSQAFDAGQPGFPCRACKTTGRLPDPDRITKCENWASEFARKRGWASAKKEEAV